MMPLRDAARAFLAALAAERAVMLNGSTRKAHADLTSALALPFPPSPVTEAIADPLSAIDTMTGIYRMGIQAAARRIDEAARAMDDRHLRSLVHGIAEDVRAMTPAPEAKTAESEVGWVIRMPHETLAEAVWGTLEEARGLRDDEPKGLIEGATAVRVRITVEPAPVEPVRECGYRSNFGPCTRPLGHAGAHEVELRAAPVEPEETPRG